jgi:hypothetical protein
MKRVLIALAMVSALAVCGTATEVTLVAGQHYDAGDVYVYADQHLLTVEIEADNGWVLLETHVYVGMQPPSKSAPGRFPYKHEALGGVSSDSYEIVLDDLELDCLSTLYIAVHAVVKGEDNGPGTETAWGDGDEIRAGKNWAMYFPTTVYCGGTK